MWTPRNNWNGHRPRPVTSRIAGPLIKHAEFKERQARRPSLLQQIVDRATERQSKTEGNDQ